MNVQIDVFPQWRDDACLRDGFADPVGFLEKSESELVRAACMGEPEGFDGLWRLYSKKIYRVTFAIVRNRADAEDAVQEAFFLAFRGIVSFEERSSFYSWLVRIARNSALSILRRRRRARIDFFETLTPYEGGGISMDPHDDSPSPEEICCGEQRREILRRAVDRLPGILKGVTAACVLEESSIQEVASQLNISRAAAKSRLHRARVSLGMMLASSGNGPSGGRSLQGGTSDV